MNGEKNVQCFSSISLYKYKFTAGRMALNAKDKVYITSIPK